MRGRIKPVCETNHPAYIELEDTWTSFGTPRSITATRRAEGAPVSTVTRENTLVLIYGPPVQKATSQNLGYILFIRIYIQWRTFKFLVGRGPNMFLILT